MAKQCRSTHEVDDSVERCVLSEGHLGAEHSSIRYTWPTGWPKEDDVADEKIDHPAHYGGAANPYEAIKVIRAWDLNFALGNAVKYVARAGKKGGETKLDDLRKARWYLDNEIAELEKAQQ